jgi:hypothetical protein
MMALDYPRQPWDGTEIDLSAYGSVIIWIETAPSTARTIQVRSGSTGTWSAHSAIPASLGDAVATISATGPYYFPGGHSFRVSGGLGGATLSIAASN